MLRRLTRLLSFDPGSLLVLGLTACAVAILWAFVHFGVEHAKSAERQKVRQDAAQVVELIEGEAARTFDMARVVLQRAVDSLEHDDVLDRFEQILSDLYVRNPEIFAIVHTDAAGKGTTTMPGWTHEFAQPPTRNFAFHRNSASDDMFISLPFVGLHSRKRQIFASMRVDAPGGPPGQIVGVIIDYDFIQNMLQHARIGAHGTVALHRLDRVLLATSDDAPETAPGRSTTKAVVWTHHAQSPVGEYEVRRSHVDGAGRLVAYHQIRNNPLLAVVTVAERDMAARDAEIERIPHRAAVGASLALGSLGLVGMFAMGRLHRLRRIAELRRKAAEAARRQAVMANAAKSRFLANMSHELRTPLNAVLGFAETIGGGYIEPVGPRTREYAANIAESGERLLLMVDELLGAAELEAGRAPLPLEAFDLRAAIGRATAGLSFELAQRRIAVEIAGSGELPVHLNRRAIEHVLKSLIANAVRFSPPDSEVRVELARTPDGEELRVVDRGAGLPPEIAARIGEPFLQNDNPLTADISGTGVGLWVVKLLVERQGGTLAAEATPGGGTTFVMRFARTAAAAA
ncbi:MAG: hypothetical protein JNN22_02740 [Rhodospirillales bacterium]|nr:hypothetical protein [Rhodospirillales bacterium]